MKKARGKENCNQRSLVHVKGSIVSDPDDGLLPDESPKKAKRSAVKSLPFGSSPAKRNAMTTNDVKVHKPKYNPLKHQQQRDHVEVRHDKLRSEYATHKMSSSAWM